MIRMAGSASAVSVVIRDPRLWTTRDLNIKTLPPKKACQTPTFTIH